MKIIGKAVQKDADKMQVFGFASASVEDIENDIIKPEELENAAYKFVMTSRRGDEMHETEGVATLIESFFITPDKALILGIDEGWMNHWWVGFQVNDAKVWEKIKSGEYTMFSIGGTADREEIEDE